MSEQAEQELILQLYQEINSLNERIRQQAEYITAERERIEAAINKTREAAVLEWEGLKRPRRAGEASWFSGYERGLVKALVLVREREEPK